MTMIIRQRPISHCAAVLACLVLAAPLEAQTHKPSKKKAVSVTGEFREDGSCQVFADGVPLFQPADRAHVSYIHDATLNVAPAGFDAHELWCTPLSPEQPMPPLDYKERLFLLMLYAPSGQLVVTRSYDVRNGIPTKATAANIVGAALFGLTPQVNEDNEPIRIGLVYLTGIRGTVIITRVDSAHVVAKFNMATQRALTL
jgi:hypothetical protein